MSDNFAEINPTDDSSLGIPAHLPKPRPGETIVNSRQMIALMRSRCRVSSAFRQR